MATLKPLAIVVGALRELLESDILSVGRVDVKRTGSNDAVCAVDAPAGRTRNLLFQSGGVARWVLYANSDAESGGNAGSTLILSYFDDAGNYVSDAFQVARATGDCLVPEKTWSFRRNSLGTGSTAGVRLSNDAAAANGAQQYSPATEFKGSGYNTGSGNAVQPVWMRLQLQTVQGSGSTEDPNHPTGDLVALYGRDAGGSTTPNGFRIKHDGRVVATNFLTGTGSPEGVVTAKVGSLYTRTDGGAGSTLYVKESGTGNTGWVAK